MLRLKDFFKKYWGLLIFAVFIVSSIAFYKKKVDVYESIMHKMQESHQKELDDVKKTREEERTKYEENEKKYKERMAIIEKEYETAKAEFEARKKTTAEKIIKNYGNKPDKLAEKLAEVTGFKIIMPAE